MVFWLKMPQNGAVVVVIQNKAPC